MEAGAGKASRAFLQLGGSIDAATDPRETCRRVKEEPRRKGGSFWPTVDVLNRNTGLRQGLVATGHRQTAPL